MKHKIAGIIGAMSCEVEGIKSLLQNTEVIQYGELTFYKGELFDKTLVVVQSGVGKVCAAVCTQILADKFSPDYIINTGVAGGLAPGMQVGDVVVADKLVYHDFDVTALGYAKGYICNNTNSKEPTYFYADKHLVELFKQAMKNKNPEVNCYQGVIASGDIFVSSNEKKKEIQDTFNAVAAEMEGAAIAHASILNKIPFAIIRAISDLADDTASKGFVFNEKKSAEISAKAIKNLMEIL